MTSRHLITAALLLALTVPAAAITCDTERLQREDVCDPTTPTKGSRIRDNNHKILPPVEYDKPFAGTLIENTARTMQDMADWCALHPPREVLGCAFRFQNSKDEEPRCRIFIAPASELKQRGLTVDAVRRHEIGHCNGWPGSHPRSLEGSSKELFDPNPAYRSTPGTARDPNKAAGE